MTQKYKLPKSSARLAVEEALKTATREKPIDAFEVSLITGLSVSLVRTHVSNCVNFHLAHNVNAAGKVGAAYAWGKRPLPGKSGNVALPRTSVTGAGRYTGEPSSALREGSMRAFDIPSLGDTERKRPFIMGARPEHRV